MSAEELHALVAKLNETGRHLIVIDLDKPGEHRARFSVGTMCGVAEFSIDGILVASEEDE